MPKNAVPDTTLYIDTLNEAIFIQNYPNPFYHSTTINYSLNQKANVSIKVYDSRGKLVSTLVDGSRNAGNHQVILNSNNMPSGIYFYQLTSGNSQITKNFLKCSTFSIMTFECLLIIHLLSDGGGNHLFRMMFLKLPSPVYEYIVRHDLQTC